MDEIHGKILIEMFLTNTNKNILKEQFVEFLYHTNDNVYDTQLSLEMKTHVSEGILHTYPIEKTIEYVKRYFNLKDEQVMIAGGDVKKINVIIPNIGTNIEEMNRAMSYCGYFLGYPNESNIQKNKWVLLQYEPLHQNNITNDLKNNEDFLYHITPSYNMGKIKNIGLSPKHKNELFNFPNRVFFFKGSTDLNYIIQMSTLLSNNNSSVANHGDYTILKVDIKNIPNSIIFYEDPNMGNGVYTKQNIHPKYIETFKEFNINNN